MTRKLRIAAACSTAVLASLLAISGSIYFASQQVDPFYDQALQVEPFALERGSRELESRATVLYSDARKSGAWQALFTADQINGWLATRLAQSGEGKLPADVRDPRIAIAPNLATLGFRTSAGGIESVVSVDATVFLTEEGAVAVRLMSVKSGALPLPVMHVADKLAAACQNLALPVRWTQEAGQPVAVVDLNREASTDKRNFHLDSIELGDGEVFVAGHTEVNGDDLASKRSAAVR